MTRRRGFALIAAMWLVALLGVGAWELSLSSRARRLAAASILESMAARGAVDAGLETARGALADSLTRVTREPSRLSPTRDRDPWSAFMSLTDTVPLGNERVAIAYHDPGARLNLNRASVDDLRRFLASLPTDAGDADRIAQRIVDWRDADDLPHPRGAERADYLRNGARRLPSNAAFATLDELQAVDGITSSLFRRIAPHLTLLGVGQTNVNAAPAEVLHALPGFGDEAVAAMIGLQREHRLIRSLDELTRHLSRGAAGGIAIAAPELASRVSFETQEIVVEATGWLDGSPVRVLGDMLVTRSGESVLVVSRHVRAQ